MIDLRVLGTLSIQPASGNEVAVPTRPKLVALLLYLVLAKPAGPQSRDRIVSLLWPEADDESARHSLRNAIYGLRQSLGDQVVIGRGEGYIEINADVVRCDAIDLRHALDRKDWQGALELFAGELAPGFHLSGAGEFEEWLETQRAQLNREIGAAAWARVEALEAAGDPDAVRVAGVAWRMDQGDEAGARRFMRLTAAHSGPAAGLQLYDQLTEYLQRAFGTAPSHETQALADALRAPTISGRSSRRSQPVDAPSVPVPVGTAPAVTRRSWLPLFMVALVVLALAVFLVRRDPVLPGASSRTGVTGLLLPQRYRANKPAYESFLRAMALRFENRLIESRDSFAALSLREPLYAPAFSGLAHAHILSAYMNTPPRDAFPRAEVAAHRSLALDSTLASGWTALGTIQLLWYWNVERGGPLIQHGLDLEPQDQEAYGIKANWYRWRLMVDSSIAQVKIGRDLNPLGTFFNDYLGRQYVLARSYDSAEAVFEQTLRNYPETAMPWNALSMVYRLTGRAHESLAALRNARRLQGDSSLAHINVDTLAAAAATRILRDLSREELARLQRAHANGNWVAGMRFAMVYAELEDTTATLAWLDSMIARREPHLANVVLHPQFDFLRQDPRYGVWEERLPWVASARRRK